MPVVTRFVAAPLPVVAAVVADAAGYPAWVVGAKRVRSVDPAWPQPGGTVHHTVGAGPLEVHDATTVDFAGGDGDRFELDLTVRAGPFGSGSVRFVLLAESSTSTAVVMHEHATGRIAHLVWNPLLDAALAMRNIVTLRRLERVVRLSLLTTRPEPPASDTGSGPAEPASAAQPGSSR